MRFKCLIHKKYGCSREKGTIFMDSRANLWHHFCNIKKTKVRNFLQHVWIIEIGRVHYV